jgi:hypothetical protein
MYPVAPQLLIRRKPLATSHASALLPKAVSNRGKSQHIVQKAGGESGGRTLLGTHGEKLQLARGISAKSRNSSVALR